MHKNCLSQESVMRTFLYPSGRLPSSSSENHGESAQNICSCRTRRHWCMLPRLTPTSRPSLSLHLTPGIPLPLLTSPFPAHPLHMLISTITSFLPFYFSSLNPFSVPTPFKHTHTHFLISHFVHSSHSTCQPVGCILPVPQLHHTPTIHYQGSG